MDDCLNIVVNLIRFQRKLFLYQRDRGFEFGVPPLGGLFSRLKAELQTEKHIFGQPELRTIYLGHSPEKNDFFESCFPNTQSKH